MTSDGVLAVPLPQSSDRVTSNAVATSSSNSNNNNIKSNVRVAVVGAGVSGLAAAWHLAIHAGYVVDVYEAADKVGGHAYTTTVTVDCGRRTIPVDCGFMVFNDINYPNLKAWFHQLGVAEEASDMSLSVSLDGGKGIEWSSNGLNGLFANRKQLLQPEMYRFIAEMVRFNTEAADLLLLHDDDPRKHVTTGQYLREHGYHPAFCTYYLLPMMAALWSASMVDVLAFPAAQLIGFLCNHQMLRIWDRPQWKTVAGRSQVYTMAVQQALDRMPTAAVFTNSPIHAARQIFSDEPSSTTTTTRWELFNEQEKSLGIYDHVIFACHPPTAKTILQKGWDMTASSTSDVSPLPATLSNVLTWLSDIEYADNMIYVHSDPSLMPYRRDAWASWNCLGRSKYLHQAMQEGNLIPSKKKKTEALEGSESGFGNRIAFVDDHDDSNRNHVNDGAASERRHRVHFDRSLMVEPDRMKAVYVTYWLNRLQNLDAGNDNVFVSLNPHHKPALGLTHQVMVMAHPQFTRKTLAARQALLEQQQQVPGGLWFCGAWTGYGFHEDGCRSGFEVATQLSRIPLPWAQPVVDNEHHHHHHHSANKNAFTKAGQQRVLPPPDLTLAQTSMYKRTRVVASWVWSLNKQLTYHFAVAICQRFVIWFLRDAVRKGTLLLKMNDGTVYRFGDGTPCGCDNSPVTLRIFDPWFFVKVAVEYDLGLARSYMAGYFVVEPLLDKTAYHPVIRPHHSRDETTPVLGDPIGLTRLFLLLIGNRDVPGPVHQPMKARRGYWYSNSLTNASGLIISRIGSMINYLRYKFTMNNSERGGSLKNIHAHYDLSNDLFTCFLDKETMMYSSAIYDAIPAPKPLDGLVFRGSLEEAQWRKLDTLLSRAQVQPGHCVLDIGFGWGGLSIYAAKKYGCHVMGITLSIEQKALAEQRVHQQGLDHLITFEVVDYRAFARRGENRGRFDRILNCEMIEAVGHDHLGEFFWAVEQLLKHDGILVMEAITTPEQRYETYRRSTDFINTIIFPGSCCPSLHALVDAAYQQSCLTLEHIDNIGLHYAQTLAEWRRRFNSKEDIVRQLGFDDVFIRAWNYYLTYCESGFFSQTEHCLILVFARQGCRSLVPLCETRSVTQQPSRLLTSIEIERWLTDAAVM